MPFAWLASSDHVSQVCWTSSTTDSPTTVLYGHHTGQPALAGTSSSELEDFAGATVRIVCSAMRPKTDVTRRDFVARSHRLRCDCQVARCDFVA